MSDLSLKVELAASFADAIERVTVALKAEGFGVLTRADIHTAFKEKIGKDFRPYVILGACNPALAHEAISSRPEAGLLLPCNVIVEETSPGCCLVRIVNAGEMMRMAGFDADPVLSHVGQEADARLKRVAAQLGSV
jgi:uncharacterized protein (DUF302 family)